MEFQNSQKKLDIKAIRDFEKSNKMSLPANYISFLLQHNGGIPTNPNYNNGGLSLYINSFFPIVYDKETSLQNEIKLFPYKFEKEVIPVALEGTGDYICLYLQDGSIYLWKHEGDYSDGIVYFSDLVFLEKDIFSFLDNLHPDETDELEEIELIGQSGDKEHLESFLKNNDIETKTRNNRTIAQEASKHGNVEILKECVKMGANLNSTLHFAALNGHKHVIDYLLSLGLDINELNDDGKTPLAYVIPYLDSELEQYMISKGAKRD